MVPYDNAFEDYWSNTSTRPLRLLRYIGPILLLAHYVAYAIIVYVL